MQKLYLFHFCFSLDKLKSCFHRHKRLLEMKKAVLNEPPFQVIPIT